VRYNFSGFVLDSEKKELYFDEKTVTLTSQSYQLLYYLVKNAGDMIDKDTLINNVWNGRVVASNTVDQSIYKLKKILNTINIDNYFESKYGQGIRFLPQVNLESKTSKEAISQNHPVHVASLFSSKSKRLIVLALLFAIILSGLFFYKSNPSKNLNLAEKKWFIIIPHSDDSTIKDNEIDSNLLLEKISNYSNTISTKNSHEKPKNLNLKQYLQTQWKQNPNLNVISTELSITDNAFTIYFSITNKQGNVADRSFTHSNLLTALNEGIHWLNLQTNSSFISLKKLVPTNSHVLESYMRGLSAVANENIEQAINYFNVCINQYPNHHLAQLELAKLYDRKGQQNQALAILDTIETTSNNATIIINAKAIRGGILLRKGKPQKALSIYQAVLNKHPQSTDENILLIKYKLSMIYNAIGNQEKSLNELNLLEKPLQALKDFDFLGHVYQSKASLFLKLGQTKKANHYVELAMVQFINEGDLIGQAKTHSVFSRIATQQADYKTALSHLYQSLNITESLNYAFGTGATLNEIINILINQGELQKAIKLNNQLKQIAIDIDFTAMALISNQYKIKLSLLLNQFSTAKIYLKEHQELANSSSNLNAVIRNYLLKLELLLAQKNLNDFTGLYEKLMEQIAQSDNKRLMLETHLIKSKYYFQKGKNQLAINLLNNSKITAKSIEDNESIIEINNLLSQHYLQQSQAKKALALLEDSMEYHPQPYPYLLLKSKAYGQLNNTAKALEFANLCKRQANELWSTQDEHYLANIKQNKP
jgi:DNA-binding winged helix-turn-helix (wHTH) protein/predicted negative regulator of RcsB-dependent stress response